MMSSAFYYINHISAKYIIIMDKQKVNHIYTLVHTSITKSIRYASVMTMFLMSCVISRSIRLWMLCTAQSAHTNFLVETAGTTGYITINTGVPVETMVSLTVVEKPTGAAQNGHFLCYTPRKQKHPLCKLHRAGVNFW